MAGEVGPDQQPEDFAVVPGDSVQFTTDIFDDVSDHGLHSVTAAGEAAVADTRVFTLKFPIITSVESQTDNQMPESYALNQNFPNPFNPSTAITFDMAQPGRAVLKIYNLIGQEIVTLIDGNLEAGRHKVDFDASNLSSGIYLYRLSINGFTDMKKMAFIK
ncbi:MAG: T9SS type A sorting domain-containing protein [Gammaproteobacteria bacterium]|nr:T9SS type A sorting domain-containing protein [Gammaproteobacteria bacterium]NIW45709.1 T9SS type A sorting domain-containing protein [Gammaproteobacteria bacterium]